MTNTWWLCHATHVDVMALSSLHGEVLWLAIFSSGMQKCDWTH